MMKQHLFWLLIIMLLALTACGSVAPTPVQSAAVQTTPEPTGEVEATPTREANAATTGDTLVPQADTVSEAAPAPEKQFGLVAARIDDRGFEQLAWEGMQQAGAEVNAHVQALPDADPATAGLRITQFLNHGFEGIVTVGIEMAQATQAAAEANPTVPFAIVDFPSQAANMKGILFDVAAPSFMAGYLAAGMSQTGAVCTYGGVPIPSVLIFMVGFEHGVEYYNQQKEASIKVLGWQTDPAIDIGGEGIFAGDFGNPAFGQTIAAELAKQGCDIIFPVAGATGLGSAEVAQANNLTVIGVDADQAVSNPDYAGVYLTSVVKRTDLAVATTVKNMANGTFGAGSNYIGNLSDGGVDLAPFHNFEAAVSSELKDELTQIRQDLIDGKLVTGWPVGASKIQTSLTAGSLNLAALRNATYQVGIKDKVTATLTNGQYLDPAADLTISLGDLVAYGDLTGDGQDEAVLFLMTDYGGTGRFYDLVVMSDQNGAPTQLASTLLGDRVQLRSLSVKEGLIVVDLVEAGPGDADCCPTQEVVKVFGLKGDQLQELSSQPVGAVSAEDSGATSVPTAPAASLGSVSLEALQNLTYELAYSAKVTAQLSNGEYRGPAVAGSTGEVVVTLSDLSILGDLNGDGVTDATAILVSQTDTGGAFYNLVAVVDQNGTPAPTASVFLGDGVEIKAVAIRSGVITLTMLVRNLTQEVTKAYQLQGNQLVELASSN
jgi:basic membrane protein A